MLDWKPCQFMLVALMMLVMDMPAMGAYFAVTLSAPHVIVLMAAHRALHYSLALLQIVVFHERRLLLLSKHGYAALRAVDARAWGSWLVGGLSSTSRTNAVPAGPSASSCFLHSTTTCSPHHDPLLCLFAGHSRGEAQFHLSLV
jgi:hypothetical protein